MHYGRGKFALVYLYGASCRWWVRAISSNIAACALYARYDIHNNRVTILNHTAAKKLLQAFTSTLCGSDLDYALALCSRFHHIFVSITAC